MSFTMMTKKKLLLKYKDTERLKVKGKKKEKEKTHIL